VDFIWSFYIAATVRRCAAP